MNKLKKLIFASGLLTLVLSSTPTIIQSISQSFYRNGNEINLRDQITDVEITFEENGGTLNGLKTINTKSNVQFKDIPNKPTVHRDGVSNQPGWYMYQNDNKVLIEDTTTFSDSKVTLYPNWKLYTVKFLAKEGHFADDSQEKIFDSVTVVHSDKIDTPTCDEKVFTGWKVGDQDVTFPYSPSGDENVITVEATYKDIEKVSVTLLSNNGLFNNTTKSLTVDVPYGSTYEEAINKGLFTTPDYDGDKLFGTWMINNTGISNTYKFTKPVLLTAYYSNAISITFDVATNGGNWSDSATQEVRVTEKIKLISNPTFKDFKDKVFSLNPKKGSVELLGWFDNKDANGTMLTDDTPITNTTSFTVYAYYKDLYHVNINGSHYEVVSKPESFCRKDTVVVKIKEEDGYTLTENILVSWNSSTKTINEDYTFVIEAGVGTLTINDAQASDITVNVDLSNKVYNINNQGTYTGVSSINSPNTAAYEASVSVSVTPATGYKIEKIEIKNDSGTTLSTITGASGKFTMPSENVKIVPTATIIYYTITKKVSVSGSGSLTVNSSATYGTSVTVSASLTTGYTLSSIVVTNSSGTTIKTITSTTGTFSMPASDVTITLNTSHPTYSVTLKKGTGVASISSSPSTIYGGTNVTISATASTGYTLSNITVVYGSTTKTVNFSSGKASFTMPYSNVTVTANAKKNNYKITAINNHNGIKSSSSNPAINTNIPYQDSVTITATANTNYKLSKITYTNGTSTSTVTFGSSTSVTFKMPANNTTIEVYSDVNDGYTLLTSSSTSGYTLNAGKYWVKSNLSFSNGTGKNGLTINGAVELYIASGVTVSCTGGAGSGKTGGGAGVYLPSGKTLTLSGSGKLVATGGNGGSGTDGSQGGNGAVDTEAADKEGTMCAGYGGAGGAGGGGGGAGVGTSGASGGNGGSKRASGGTVECFKKYCYAAIAGNAGSNGNNAEASGTLTKNNVTVSATGGSAGASAGNGGLYGTSKNAKRSSWNNRYSAASGGGGGGGGSGLAGNATGKGGGGGGGGGSGAAGGTSLDSSNTHYPGASGGSGGSGYYSGGGGGNTLCHSDFTRAAGGTGGSKGS